MSNEMKTPSNWEKKAVRTTVNLGFWTLAWVLTMALATFGPKFIWSGNDTLTAIGIGLNFIIGLGTVVANKRHLQSLDEMHQKVQLEAMALALGVAVVAGLAYSNLDVSNLIEQDAEISHLILVIGATYMTGIFFGMRRYR